MIHFDLSENFHPSDNLISLSALIPQSYEWSCLLSLSGHCTVNQLSVNKVDGFGEDQ